jgi:hypothetical protein
MGTTRNEYHRFLGTLNEMGAPDDVRRLARVVWDHMDRIGNTSAVRRARSRVLAPLVIRSMTAMPLDVPAVGNREAGGQTFARVRQLVVGPFRGFMRRESFDLGRAITLVYGANGTGKSSFCEALERALLGHINEAAAKRIDQRQYCNNARLGRHLPPELEVADEQGNVVPLRPDEDAFQFCFVEKNRIDGFARIAARPPADQRQIIATLFGVEGFNDFVRGFNGELDAELNLTGAKTQELLTKRQALAAAEDLIRGVDDQMLRFREQEAAWAHRVLPQQTYEEAKAWLFGQEEAQGRLDDVRAVLDAPLPPLHDIHRHDLEERLTEHQNAATQLHQMIEQLRVRSDEVSYQQLYEAVIALAEVSPEACPACQTPLNRTQINPFARAQEGLEALAELAALQRQQRSQQQQMEQTARTLLHEMRRVFDAMQLMEGIRDVVPLPGLPAQPAGDWLVPWLASNRAAWDVLLGAADGFEQQDAQTKQAQADRTPLFEERNRLEEFEREHIGLMSVQNAWRERLEAAQQLMNQFEADNHTLIEEATAEGPVIAHHQRIKAAYDDFLPRLRAFMEGLPGQLLQGLGESANRLYNLFNRDDPPGDLLHALHLPVAEEEKIELEFVGEPGRRYDALQILSEGHIRCLGLSILMAKNIEQGCPVCIFDDAVNAIDDDHRNGIWRTLFEDRVLGNKQVILTSHAEEFLLRIQQNLGIERVRQDVRCYKFLPGTGDHELVVDTQPPTKNYLLLARQAIEQDDKREALRQARPALESLTDRLWSWLGRHGDGRIELKLAGPRAPWELNNKCSKLRSALRGRAEPPAVLEACGALDALLGVNANSIEWGNLNSGVHDSERDHEFDRDTVRTIVDALTRLDGAIAALQGN